MIADKHWDGLIVLHASGEVIGTALRRNLKNLHVREATLPKAAAADYYCIHPAWRKRGIGRAILATYQNTTPAPTPPVLVFWDKPQIKVPPMITGLLLSRKCGTPGISQAIQIKDPARCKAAWLDCVKGVDVWTEEAGEEISFWTVPGGTVVVWNSFHRTVPDGGLIGIVLSRDAKATEALANAKSQWGVLLAPVRDPFTHSYPMAEWSVNSIFQWVGYNLSVGFMSGVFPVVGF